MLALGLMVTEKKIFEGSLAGGVVSLDPRGLIGKNYVGDH